MIGYEILQIFVLATWMMASQAQIHHLPFPNQIQQFGPPSTPFPPPQISQPRRNPPFIPSRPFLAAAPAGPFAPILQQHFDISPEGSYTFGYDSADGSVRQETASVKGVPNEREPILVVQGSYGYVSTDGERIDVQYIADENGYQPSGAGIHPAILKAVAYQVAKAREEQGQRGPGPNEAFPIPPPFPIFPTEATRPL